MLIEMIDTTPIVMPREAIPLPTRDELRVYYCSREWVRLRKSAPAPINQARNLFIAFMRECVKGVPV